MSRGVYVGVGVDNGRVVIWIGGADKDSADGSDGGICVYWRCVRASR